MRLLASGESLCCAANILLFCPRKTADILNYPQRQRATQKRNNSYAKEKRIQDLPLVIGRSPSVAPVSSLRRKRFRAISEQRTRSESQRPRIKLNGGSKRAGRWWSTENKWTSGPCGDGGWERIRRIPPLYGPDP